MIDESEVTDVAVALGRYRPASPDAAKVEVIAAALAHPRSSGRWRWWSGAAAAVVVAGIALWAWQASQQQLAVVPTDDVSAEFSQAWLKQTRVALPWETPQTSVVVTVFLDWMCLGCFVLDQNLIEALEKLERVFPGRIAVVFEDWPLDPSCNATVTTDVHPG